MLLAECNVSHAHPRILRFLTFDVRSLPLLDPEKVVSFWSRALKDSAAGVTLSLSNANI